MYAFKQLPRSNKASTVCVGSSRKMSNAGTFKSWNQGLATTGYSASDLADLSYLLKSLLLVLTVVLTLLRRFFNNHPVLIHQASSLVKG